MKAGFIKTISIVMVVLVLSMLLITPLVQASSIEEALGEGVDTSPKEVDKGVAQKILGAMQWFGYALAVGMLIYIGIKYVMAAADERADLKNSLIKYAIGALLIVAASTVVGIIFNIGNTSNSSNGSSAKARKPSTQQNGEFWVNSELE